MGIPLDASGEPYLSLCDSWPQDGLRPEADVQPKVDMMPRSPDGPVQRFVNSLSRMGNILISNEVLRLATYSQMLISIS